MVLSSINRIVSLTKPRLWVLTCVGVRKNSRFHENRHFCVSIKYGTKIQNSTFGKETQILNTAFLIETTFFKTPKSSKSKTRCGKVNDLRFWGSWSTFGHGQLLVMVHFLTLVSKTEHLQTQELNQTWHYGWCLRSALDTETVIQKGRQLVLGALLVQAVRMFWEVPLSSGTSSLASKGSNLFWTLDLRFSLVPT